MLQLPSALGEHGECSSSHVVATALAVPTTAQFYDALQRNYLSQTFLVIYYRKNSLVLTNIDVRWTQLKYLRKQRDNNLRIEKEVSDKEKKDQKDEE